MSQSKQIEHFIVEVSVKQVTRVTTTPERGDRSVTTTERQVDETVKIVQKAVSLDKAIAFAAGYLDLMQKAEASE